MAETRAQKLARIEKRIKEIQAEKEEIAKGVTTLKKAKTKAPTTKAPTTPTTPTEPTPSKVEQISAVEEKIAKVEKQITEYQSVLSKAAEAGITTGEIPAEFLKGISFDIPEAKTTEPDLTEAKSLTEYYRKQIEIQQKQATEAKGAYEKYLKTSQEQQKTWWEKITAKPTITETAEEYYEKLGIKPEEYFAERSADIAAVDVLMQEYDTAVAAKQMALVKEEERLAPMEFISARMNRVEKEANIRLSQMAAGVNTKLAVMEMKSGNFEQARSLVQEAVTNYTNDLRWEYQMFVDFREQNQEIIRELDKKYQTALDKAEQYALLSWQKKEEDTTNIANLMLQYPAAGISFGDTIQEATEKASRWAVAHPEEKWQIVTRAGQVYRVDPTTGRMERLGEIPAGADAGWMDFTDKEKRELATAGINWTAPAKYESVPTPTGYKSVLDPSGYEKALEYLYGEEIKVDITKDWIRNLYTPEQLKEVATEAGFTTIVRKGWFGKEEIGDTEAYLDYLINVVQQYKGAGFTDKQILGLIGIKE